MPNFSLTTSPYNSRQVFINLRFIRRTTSISSSSSLKRVLPSVRTSLAQLSTLSQKTKTQHSYSDVDRALCFSSPEEIAPPTPNPTPGYAPGYANHYSLNQDTNALDVNRFPPTTVPDVTPEVKKKRTDTVIRGPIVLDQ